MRCFRFFTQKILLVCLLVVIIIEIILKQNPFGLFTFLCIVVIFLIESAYYILEKTTKEVRIFNTGNKSQHRKNSIILISLSLLVIFVHNYKVGFVLEPNLSMSILLILGLRGLLFTNQTVKSIRVFKQGIEYGFWLKFISWDNILEYSINSNAIIVYLEKKQIILRFANSNDLISFVYILQTKK